MSSLNIGNIGIYLVFGAFALALLPASPFTAFTDAVASVPYLDILNWFLPITEVISILQAWLVAITAFYVVQMLLRALNIIGS